MPRMTALAPVFISLIALPLMGCTFGAPPEAATSSQSADLNACTQQADRIFAARHYAYLSRTDQMATPRSGLPDQQYIHNRLADIHERDDHIKDCMRNGNPANTGSEAGLPAPQIIGPSQ